jgi:O-antigen/teichoic acid export membrane protein
VALGIVSTPILLGRLGPDAYGLLALAGVTTSYLGLLDLGLGAAVVHALSSLSSEDRDNNGEVVGSALALYVGLGLLGGAALSLSAPWLSEVAFRIPAALQGDARRLFVLTGAQFALGLPAQAFAGALRASRRFDLLGAIDSGSASLATLGAIGVVLSGGGIVGVAEAYLAAAVFGTAAYSLAYFRQPTARATLSFRFGHVRRLCSLGIAVAGSNVTATVALNAEKLVLSVLLPVARLTHYQIPFSVVTKLWIVPASLTTPLFPELADLHARGRDEAAKSTLVTGLRWAMLATLPASGVLLGLGPAALRLWLGSTAAHEQAVVLRILSIGLPFSSLGWIATVGAQATGVPALATVTHVLQACLHIGLSMTLIPIWGIEGAAFAWALHHALGLPLLLSLLARRPGWSGIGRVGGGVGLRGVAVLGLFAGCALALEGLATTWAGLVGAVCGASILALPPTFFVLLTATERRALWGVALALRPWSRGGFR